MRIKSVLSLSVQVFACRPLDPPLGRVALFGGRGGGESLLQPIPRRVLQATQASPYRGAIYTLLRRFHRFATRQNLLMTTKVAIPMFALVLVLMPGGEPISRALPLSDDEVLATRVVATRSETGRAYRPPVTVPLDRLGAESLKRDAPPRRASIVAVQHEMKIRKAPASGEVLGVMPAGSPWFGVPTNAWVFETSPDGRFGKVAVPYSSARRTGWIRIDDLKVTTTPYEVSVDISDRKLKVTRRGRAIFSLRVAVGQSISPTPPGRYFVTDLIPFDPGGPLGAFAFGLSGVQPDLPPGWYGGDQLAIHGTNSPSTIGQAVTAGCVRVTNDAIERLKPLLKLGTPVVFRP